MKITVEVDGYEWQEKFEEFYERVRAERQMRNGRAVDRKALRQLWREQIRQEVEYYIDDSLFSVLTHPDVIEAIVDELDEKAENKLYKMVKEYA